MHVRLRLAADAHETEHDVWLVRDNDTVALELDGKRLEARVKRTGPSSFVVTLDGHDVRVDVHDQHTASIDGHRVEFELPVFQPRGAPGEHDTSIAVGGVVHPPMAGKIVRLEVAQGDEVEQGQTVAVLEAMKMQSAIQAPRAGVVVAIGVQAGEAVEPRDVVCEIGERPA